MTLAIRTEPTIAEAPRARQHGDLDQPGAWTIRCDHPGCGAELTPSNMTYVSDLHARRVTRAFAEQNGWYITLDRGAAEKSKDLCPAHARRR